MSEIKNKTKKMTIAEAIAVSLNVSLKESITADELVEILRSGVLPQNRVPHIGILFNKIHFSELKILFQTYNIPLVGIQRLYLATPLFYHNPETEAFLNGNKGKTNE